MTDDTISRKMAIDELDKGAWGVEWDKTLAKTMIESLPSAQHEPQIIRCKDCRYWDRNIQYATLGVCHIWGETERTRNDYCSEARCKDG